MTKIFHFLLCFIAVSNVCFGQILNTVICYDNDDNPQDTMTFECLADIGVFEEPAAVATGYCPSTQPTSDLLPNFTLPSNPNFNFSFIVTIDSDPNITQDNEEVVAVSSDGIVDFTGFAPATYCFTAISYQQSALDIITNNTYIQSNIPSYCLNGNESLEEIIFCIKDNFALADIESVTDSVLNDIVPILVPEFQTEYDPVTGMCSFNAPFCFDITPDGSEYCIELLGPADGCIVGIDEVFQSEIGLQNSPNPVNASTTIQFELLNTNTVNLFVFDINGIEVFNKNITTNNGLNSYELSAENLNNGLYYYGIRSEGKAAVQKMLIQK